MRYLAILAVMLLSGCSMLSKTEEDFSCPNTGFVADADTISFDDDAVTAVIDGFTGNCSFKDSGAAKIELTLPFIARRSAAAAAAGVQEQELAYFVAVLSPEDEILQRQAFSTKVVFNKDTGEGVSEEEHVIKIPLADPAAAYKYKVVIGFNLTPEQLKHNKERK